MNGKSATKDQASPKLISSSDFFIYGVRALIKPANRVLSVKKTRLQPKSIFAVATQFAGEISQLFTQYLQPNFFNAVAFQD